LPGAGAAPLGRGLPAARDPPFRHARHYLGFAATSAILPRRLRKHATGKGATLLRAARAAGCDFELVRLWPGTRSLERQFKQRKAAPRLLCPLCRAHRRLAATAGQGTLLDPTSYLDLGGWSR
jgi:hypothetical protein